MTEAEIGAWFSRIAILVGLEHGVWTGASQGYEQHGIVGASVGVILGGMAGAAEGLIFAAACRYVLWPLAVLAMAAAIALSIVRLLTAF